MSDSICIAMEPGLLQKVRWFFQRLWHRVFPGKCNLVKHAEREFQYLRESVSDALVLEFEKEILALVRKFGNSGQSGGSAPYVSRAISDTLQNLLMFKPLGGITGDDWEWDQLDSGITGRPGVAQNRRLSSVFKEDGRAYYLDAIVFKGPDRYDTFTGNVEDVKSSAFIKSFPFVPKTFYIDVDKTPDTSNPDRVSCRDGDYLYTIKDRDQLKAVYEYYDPRD